MQIKLCVQIKFTAVYFLNCVVIVFSYLNVVTRVTDQLQGEPAPPAAAPDEADRDRAEGRHGALLQQQQQQQLLRGRGRER